MKTVVIWDQLDADPKFFVYNGDLSHLNHKYINSSDTTDAEVDELNQIVYYPDGPQAGEEKVTMLDEFPVEEVKAGAKVIVAGFLP